MTNTIATLTVDHKKRTILDLNITQKQFKFKCKRGATLCCNLGGPILSKNDVNQIQSAGHALEDFLEPPKNNDDNSSIVCGSLKTRHDGSCIFLDYDKKTNKCTCSIYDSRPALCRLYPFDFELLDSGGIALKFIPCCLGLNNPEGKILDKEFVTTVLLEPLLDAMQLRKNEKI